MRSSPADLARGVGDQLRQRSLPVPDERHLLTIFETLFYVSLKTEEGQPITCHVVYLDPQGPSVPWEEPRPHDHWHLANFETPLDFSDSHLTKLAKATDPRSSSIAIYPDGGGVLRMWGLVDQGNSFFGFIQHEQHWGLTPPGIFQASIEGVGRVAAYAALTKVAELDGSTLSQRQMSVLEEGPIHSILRQRFEAEPLRQVIEHLEAKCGPGLLVDPDMLFGFWISMLSRLLLRVRSYHHGGAVVLADGNINLQAKYELHYLRLRRGIPKFLFQTLVQAHARNQMRQQEEHLPDGREMYPKRLTLDALGAGDQSIQTDREIDDAIWFISTLTRVDGAVVMDPFLGLHGFGAEIKVDQDPPRLFLAGDTQGSAENRQDLDTARYGMRHRSMVRWCWTAPQSIGFVVSQDGDVRAVKRVDDGVMLWDNVKLQRLVPSTDRPREETGSALQLKAHQ